MLQNMAERGCVIVYMQPVAHLIAGAVDRQRLPIQRFGDHQWDQFLRELPGPVVVGAVGQDDRQAISLSPSLHQVIARGFRSGIGRARCVGRSLGKWRGIRGKGAEHLVGRDMQKAELRPLTGRLMLMVRQRRLQDRVGAEHVGLDEGFGRVDGSIDMAFRRQMDHRLGPVAVECRAHRRRIADIGLHEGIARIGVKLGQRFGGRGVGQLVDVDDGRAVTHQPAHHRTADKAGAACHQDLQNATILRQAPFA